MLAAGPAVLWFAEAAEGVDGPLGPAPEGTPAALHDPVPTPSPAPSAGPPVGATPAPAPAPPPVRIRALDAGVDAPIVATGVDAHGGMAIPHDVRTVGWYRFGVGPGAPAGSAVLAAHVDDRIQGYGAFHRLGQLTVGDRVQVTLADGTVVAYRAGAVERVAKAALPADRVFGRDGPPRLTLVTCGGAFDRAVGGYLDNVVVTATPEAGS